MLCVHCIPTSVQCEWDGPVLVRCKSHARYIGALFFASEVCQRFSESAGTWLQENHPVVLVKFDTISSVYIMINITRVNESIMDHNDTRVTYRFYSEWFPYNTPQQQARVEYKCTRHSIMIQHGMSAPSDCRRSANRGPPT